jgi:outer membrane usher protein
MISLVGTVSMLAIVTALQERPAENQAPASEVVAETQAPALSVPDETRRKINPYNRDINLTVPLNFNNRVLGELPVILTKDDRFLVESLGFKTLLNPLLLADAQQELDASLTGHEYFAPEEINATGIRLDYDPSQLAVMVLRIDANKRTVESLFANSSGELKGLAPEPFSAYLNVNTLVQRYESTGDVSTPSVFLSGAVRYGGLVFEADVQGREDFFTGDYDFERRYARLVYDQPESFRRWTLGDIDAEIRGRQGFVEMGGLGIQRQRRRFDSSRATGLTSGRALVLQEASTVRVMRNGVLVRELRLDAGQYDLSNLPLDAGSNQLNIEVVSDSGRIENVQYSAYLDMIDLDPGDYEYGAFLGVTGNGLGGSPDYSDGELAFTGYWRKAFENKPALGLGLQLSEDTQMASAQTQFILKNGARLQFDAGVSNSDIGQGFALGGIFDHIVDLGETADSYALAVDYNTEEFSPLGGGSLNQNSWTFSGSYNHRFSINWSANLNASYRLSHREDQSASYAAVLSTSYRFTPTWSVQAGLEYVNYGSGGLSALNDGLGFSVNLVWQPRADRRMDSRYQSTSNYGTVSYQQYSSNRVGALGYSVTGNYNDGPGSISGQVDYTANRFNLGLSHVTFGRDFSRITDDQVTGLRLGTSISTAGGKVAIGRPIYDSFAIVHGHESLDGKKVVVGESFEGGNYVSRSGALGPAVSSNLASYTNQSVRYDVLDPPLGYNIGDGVKRVHPSYRSGYVIEVGSAKFVSAMGRLVGNGDRPIALTSGQIRPADEPEAAPEMFFTNSVGRFAMQDLEPGKSYRVHLFTSPPVGFEFTVPEDNEGLLDMKILRVPVDVPED